MDLFSAHWKRRTTTPGSSNHLAARPRFVSFRDDRPLLLDLILNLGGNELLIAIRILANGDGSEIVLTLVQSHGLPDAAFLEHTRWAGSALAELKLMRADTLPVSKSREVPSLSMQEGNPFHPFPRPIPAQNEMTSFRRPAEDYSSEIFPSPGRRNRCVSFLPSMAPSPPSLFPRLRGRGGRSRGFGFVEMSTEAEAQTAIEQLHEGLAGDRKIIVRLARSREIRPPLDGAVAPDLLPSEAMSEEGHASIKDSSGVSRLRLHKLPRPQVGVPSRSAVEFNGPEAEEVRSRRFSTAPARPRTIAPVTTFIPGDRDLQQQRL